jgi:hypothetical protein
MLRERLPLEVQIIEAADALAVAFEAYRCKFLARRMCAYGKAGSRRVAHAASRLSSGARGVLGLQVAG